VSPESSSAAARDVTATGTVTATCVDELDDLSMDTGIDLDSVSISEEDGFLVATFSIASIHALIDTHSVALDSLLQANDRAAFTLDLEPILDQHGYVSVTVWLTPSQKWNMMGWRTPGGDFPIFDGSFEVPDGKTAVMRVPLDIVPAGDLEWSVMVLNAYSWKDFCPGGLDESGQSLLFHREDA
jgi:hypothetical protein